MARLDLISKRFGGLIVVKEVPKKGKERNYLCQCDCGNQTIVRQGSLRQGNTTSCGCYRNERVSQTQRFDHTGKRYGKLIATKRVGRSKKTGASTTPLWLCQCDCGKTTTVSSNNLISDHTKTCGSCITKGSCMEDLKKIHNKYGIISNKDLHEKLPYSINILRNRFNKMKMREIWALVKKEIT